MFEIVAGIDDDDQLLGWHHTRQTQGEFGAADAAGQGDDHRNRSSSGGRTSSAMEASGAVQLKPRTMTTGWPSAAWPCNKDAAAAISSAKPMMLTSRMRPNRSGWPRRSITDGMPADPIATPAVPRRHGRPKLSLITTPTSACDASADRIASADPSGSNGN